jgi:hypothetical protein
MQRKKFIQSISAAALLSLPYAAAGVPGKIPDNRKTIKPEKLRKGSRVGLISPGSFITGEELDESIKNLYILIKFYCAADILREPMKKELQI